MSSSSSSSSSSSYVCIATSQSENVRERDTSSAVLLPPHHQPSFVHVFYADGAPSSCDIPTSPHLRMIIFFFSYFIIISSICTVCVSRQADHHGFPSRSPLSFLFSSPPPPCIITIRRQDKTTRMDSSSRFTTPTSSSYEPSESEPPLATQHLAKHPVHTHTRLLLLRCHS